MILKRKLLILGGTTLMIHVVNTAKKLGIVTVVTDVSPNSPAKKYADISYNISTGDLDAIEAMARKEQIDGVFT